MGTLKNGTLGGFSGTTGKVVGASWRGIEYVRSLPSKVNDPKTKDQMKQRSRFSVAMDFHKLITPFLRIGFQAYANERMTAFNAAMSYNMKYGVAVNDHEAVLDYPNVRVARGELTVSPGIQVAAEGAALHVSWEDTLLEGARADDVVMVLAYNPAKQQSVYDINAGKRGVGSVVFALPESWKGHSVETYVAFKTADGGKVSESVYGGRHAV